MEIKYNEKKPHRQGISLQNLQAAWGLISSEQINQSKNGHKTLTDVPASWWPRGMLLIIQFSSVAHLCPTLCDSWTAACQASLFITNSQSLLKLMSIESVIPSNYLILCHPLLFLPSIFPASGSFPMSQLFASGGQSTGVSASTSFLPMNTQDWFPLGWTGCISLQSKGLSRVFSNTTVKKHQFFSAQLSL